MKLAGFCQIFFVIFHNKFSPGLCSSTQLSAEKVDAIEKLLEKSLFKTGKSPALALSVVTKSSVLYKGAKGFQNLDLAEKNNDTSPSENMEIQADEYTGFGIASITKGFTATLAVKLLSEKFPDLGESVLDIPIRRLIPDYNFILSDRLRTETTTFRDLLAHKTCLNHDLFGTLTDAYDGFEDFVFRQRFSKEKCAIRSEFIYNNGMYSLAGDILAHIGNMSYLQLMEDFLLQIGMLNSTFVKDSDNSGPSSTRANPYLLQNGKIVPFNSELLKIVVPGAPAGGIVSSASDMGKYMQFHLNLGKIGDDQLINAGVIKWLYKPVSFVDHTSYKLKSTDISDFEFGYGLGFATGAYDGYQKHSHGGSLPPFESLMSIYPQLDLGIFTVTSGPTDLLFNTGQKELHAKIADIVMDFTRPPNSTITSSRKQVQQVEKVINTETTHNQNERMNASKINLEAWVGHYGSLFSGDLEIILKNQSKETCGTVEEALWFNYGRWGKGWLMPLMNDNASPGRNNTKAIALQVKLDSDLLQLIESAGIPELMSEFHPSMGHLIFFFKGQENENIIFKKGLHSKKCFKESKNLNPWNIKC